MVKDKQLQEAGFDITDYDVVQLHTAFTNKIEQVDSVGDLLLAEALMTKRLYHYAKPSVHYRLSGIFMQVMMPIVFESW